MDYVDKRTNLATASVVNQGIAWRDTYGTRSAAAFLAHRAIPRAVIRRVVNTGDTRAAEASQQASRRRHNYLINQADT